MSEKDKGADKTEPPTRKRILDARKEGNVSKSRDLTGTVLVMGWLVTAWMLVGSMHSRINNLFEQSLATLGQPFETSLPLLAQTAIETFLWLMLPLLAMSLMLGLLIEFLQVGPLLSWEKVKPKMDKLNPVEGIKKMFSMDNLVDLIKSIVKSAALIGIGWIVVRGMLPDLLQLTTSPPEAIGAALWQGLSRIVIWTICVFFFISALDTSYQKYSYLKNLRMSRRDIRQELKDSEGDPHVKQRRRQLHQEWSQQNMMHAVRGANVVVTNPTHIAIALRYQDGETDLPIVVAKGEGHTAEMIRQAAEEAGVPILQNIPLARGLHEKVALDDHISNEFFEAVAEVLHWAEGVRDSRD
ncbi:type III secretion system export apparatus subunit SctU [Lysobacter ciconiae]|uniref:Type III secretion system export apparatus subunit SctU n=1 Tax=Novilysobacter ciconiae TaxID=2781022 RepID=A0A7S6UHD7_9GAMM|nr:type III secretion system export apparatus subunit SctU [Lysobacter ciconiae]QOW20348.1 type III secretion system export apparatus subunit SctU [Lysobacter ciconiae]